MNNKEMQAKWKEWNNHNNDLTIVGVFPRHIERARWLMNSDIQLSERLYKIHKIDAFALARDGYVLAVVR